MPHAEAATGANSDADTAGEDVVNAVRSKSTTATTDNVQVPSRWSQLSLETSELEDFVQSHKLGELDSIKMTRRMPYSIDDPLPPRTSWEDDLKFTYTITTTDCSRGQRPVVLCQTMVTNTSRLNNLK